nr:MAG TPA: hypothetical protein [Caudoviricetes sp.]
MAGKWRAENCVRLWSGSFQTLAILNIGWTPERRSSASRS